LSKVALGSHYGIGLLGAMAAHSIHNVSCQYFSTGGEIGVFLDKKTGKPKTEELA
jgi:hypothetical protein